MRTRRPLQRVLAALVLTAGAQAGVADGGALRVRFVEERNASRTLDLTARLLVEAADGGILIEDGAGTLHSITPDRLLAREPLGEPFTPFDADVLGISLRAELGDAFEIVRTRHYVIATSADRKYAEWVGALFERLLRGFLQHWERSGLAVSEPAAPLPAIVFRTQQEYAAYAERDAGAQLSGTVGYYSVRANRIILYDLATAVGGGPLRTDEEVSRRVSAAPANVATIVHEATHQIAFNCGLHTRYADNPMWVTEGMAMYFETPDLRSGSGWQTAGRLNVTRLRRFRDFAQSRRGDDSLASLLTGESRFRDPDLMPDAYAESWALSYFLIRTRREEFVNYLRQLSAKPRLKWDAPEQRLREFETAFGDVQAIEQEFLQYVKRLGGR